MLRRPKIVCSLSYADYRPKTNAVILLNMGHMLRGKHLILRRIRERKGNIKLECAPC
jgi:hypothetical protein